jgi:hypothetical protein
VQPYAIDMLTANSSCANRAQLGNLVVTATVRRLVDDIVKVKGAIIVASNPA